MFAKQLTVFIENRAGRLSEVLGVLKENDVNILSMSLADTTEFGLLCSTPTQRRAFGTVCITIRISRAHISKGISLWIKTVPSSSGTLTLA